MKNEQVKSKAFALALLLLVTPLTHAQRAPEAGYIFPAGGKAGATVDVVLGTYNGTPDLEYIVSDPRVRLVPSGPPGPILVPPPPYWFGAKGRLGSLPIPRETAAKLVIPGDVAPGFVYVQVANANGVSSPVAFLVGEASDLVEDETATDIQRLPQLPATVSGRLLKNEEVDRYKFTAPSDGPITCDLQARRLGSKFLGILEVRDAQGRLVADVLGSHSVDPIVTFAAGANAEYTVSIRDVDFAGDRSFVYRLCVTASPRIVAAHPAAGKQGETRDVEFIVTDGAKIETVRRSVTFPATDSSFGYRFETPRGKTPAFPLLVSRHPQSFSTSKSLPAPGGITGVFDRSDEEHRYECTWKKGEVWSLRVDARSIDSPLDVSLAIDAPPDKAGKRKEFARNEDLAGTIDAGLDFTVPADGLYEIVVSDVAGKGGSPAAVYRLEIAAQEPDFALSLPTPKWTVTLGGKSALAVKALRRGGFKGPIALTLHGLPEGITTAANLVIPAGKNELAIALNAAADAGTSARRVTLVGTATIGAAPVERIAHAAAPVHLITRDPVENQMASFVVATVMKQRFKGRPVDQDTGRKVPRGSTHPAEILIDRFDGFQGEIMLRMAAQQSYAHQGITGGDVVVPPETKKTIYPCFMPEWLESTRTSRMAIIAVAKVADPKGKARYLVSDISGFVTMTMEGALLKITSDDEERRLPAGAPFDVNLKVARLTNLAEPVRIELIAPKGLARQLEVEPVIAIVGQERVAVRVTPSANLTGHVTFKLRATALQDGKYLVMSETPVRVDLRRRP
jgi:hypothetical protein